MAANVAPIFGLSPVIGQVSIAAANANRDGTGALGLLKTGTANGSRIDFVVAKATVSTNAGMLRLYIDDGAGNIFLWEEYSIPSFGASPTNPASRRVMTCAFVLPSGYKLQISSQGGEQFRCFAHGQDY